MKKKKYKNIVIMILFSYVLYIILDLLNLPSKLGLAILDLNIDIFNTITGAVIALTLYFISYNEIDDRAIKREENARNTAKILIMNTYKECLQILEIVNNKEVVEKQIVPKVDFNKTDKDNEVIHNFKTLPFETFNKIMGLAENGYLSEKELETYLFIKKEFSYIVSMKIVLFDLDEGKRMEQIHVTDTLKKQYDKLFETINSEIKRLKSV